MNFKKALFSLSMAAFITVTSLGFNYNNALAENCKTKSTQSKQQTTECKDKENSKKVGETRFLVPGDKLVFQVIPSGQEQPVDSYYYEEITDKTYVTPKGQTVKLNSLGTLGQPASVFFCYTQDSNRNIYYYGSLVPNPQDPTTNLMEEWVTVPESGYTLNYPGKHYIGLEWDSKFESRDQFGNIVASVDVTYKVECMEKIETPLGKFKAFKIVCKERNGELNSIAWFSPELGVNVKKISYSVMRPGYQLTETHFVNDKK